MLFVQSKMRKFYIDFTDCRFKSPTGEIDAAPLRLRYIFAEALFQASFVINMNNVPI